MEFDIVKAKLLVNNSIRAHDCSSTEREVLVWQILFFEGKFFRITPSYPVALRIWSPTDLFSDFLAVTMSYIMQISSAVRKL